jgi:putative SOS response-associated peptidase YedK
MCGRLIQSGGPLRYGIVASMDMHDSTSTTIRQAGTAPSSDLLVIRRNHQIGQASHDRLRWSLIPCCCEDRKGGRKLINAKCETVGTLPTFRDAFADA